MKFLLVKPHIKLNKTAKKPENIKILTNVESKKISYENKLKISSK